MSKQQNLEAFSEDIEKLDKLMKISRHLLKLFTFDNSFETFLDNVIFAMVRDVKNAITEEEIKPSLLRNDLIRYVKTMHDSLNTRLPDYNLTILLREVNQLFENWMTMIDQFKLLEKIDVDEKTFEALFTDITDIYDLLDMSLSIEKIVDLTQKLTRRAEKILSAVPPIFNISEHFLQVLKEE